MNTSIQPDSADKQPREDHDSPWKQALELRFGEFLTFLFPRVAESVDLSKPMEFLDKELQQIAPKAHKGRTYADKLVKVQLKDGKSQWLLVHVEVQGAKDNHFAERMYRYFARIRERYRHQVVSLAVLTDSNPSFVPSHYEVETLGCKLVFEFPVFKLWDWKDRVDELLASENMFAWVVAAQLQAKRYRAGRPRLKEKIRLLRILYTRGYSETEVLELFALFDWMMSLSDNLSREFMQAHEEIEREFKMRYVTSTERIARQEGRLEGELKGRMEAGVKMVSELGVSASNVSKTLQIPLEELLARLKSINDTQ